MQKSHFLNAAEACLENGERLLGDTESVLYDKHPPATSFTLAMIAQEEFAKAFLLLLVHRDVIPWDSFLHRATRDHACKQLVGLVLGYLAPDWNEEQRRHKGWLTEMNEHRRLIDEYKRSSNRDEQAKFWKRIQEISRKLDSLPAAVADSIFMLRHEKIGRWESSSWAWVDEPDYHPLAKELAEGKLDHKKQDSLYVRLGRDGQVAGTPSQIKHDEAKAAIELTGRMRSFVKYMLDYDNRSIEHRKVEAAFKAVFGSNQKDTESHLENG